MAELAEDDPIRTGGEDTLWSDREEDVAPRTDYTTADPDPYTPPPDDGRTRDRPAIQPPRYPGDTGEDPPVDPPAGPDPAIPPVGIVEEWHPDNRASLTASRQTARAEGANMTLWAVGILALLLLAGES